MSIKKKFWFLGSSKKFALWLRKTGVTRKLGIAVSIAALLSGIATYIALTTHGAVSQKEVFLLLNLDLVLLLMLCILIARRLVIIRLSRKKNAAGSKLHVRLVLLFGLLAATPAILVTTFSAAFFHFGLKAWFSEQVRTAVNESLQVAESYLDEHRQLIVSDALIVANSLNNEWGGVLTTTQGQLNQILADKTLIRGLDEAIVFNDKGQVLAKAGLTFSLQFEQVPLWALEKAQAGEVAILKGDSEDRLRALVKLNFPMTIYLYIGRFVDANVLAHIDRATQAVAAYERLEGSRSAFEITFVMLFIVAAMLLVMAAIWLSLILSSKLATPITDLISAAEKVKEGDLNARVKEKAYADEISVLGRTFNRMTEQLLSQREQLISTNKELDERRLFTEAVLSGVSAGVIAIDKNKRIRLANVSADNLLTEQLNNTKGKVLSEIIPEFSEPLKKAEESESKSFNGEITVTNIKDKKPKIFQLKIASETVDGKLTGYVITFDDITELQEAQKKAAWSDVARRVAHEIKNPLTPIQLSAERLKKKYLPQIKDGAETFKECTDTIIRQVAEIGDMVTEFSSFARMPEPKMQKEDLNDIIRKSVFMQRIAYKGIVFEMDATDKPVYFRCDRQQINQALTNLFKNYIEAIHDANKPYLQGKITVTLKNEGGNNILIMEDNGAGLPDSLTAEKLSEPYVTGKASGTGLGLSIVRKIIEDHGGSFKIENRYNKQSEIIGAKITIEFKGSENGENGND